MGGFLFSFLKKHAYLSHQLATQRQRKFCTFPSFFYVYSVRCDHHRQFFLLYFLINAFFVYKFLENNFKQLLYIYIFNSRLFTIRVQVASYLFSPIITTFFFLYFSPRYRPILGRLAKRLFFFFFSFFK